MKIWSEMIGAQLQIRDHETEIGTDRKPTVHIPKFPLYGCCSGRKRRRIGAPIGGSSSPTGCGAVGSGSGSGPARSGVEDQARFSRPPSLRRRPPAFWRELRPRNPRESSSGLSLSPSL